MKKKIVKGQISSPTCKGCGKTPEEIKEYVEAAKEEGCTPTEFVRGGEGTYSIWSNKFYCTECYIKAGMPLGQA